MIQFWKKFNFLLTIKIGVKVIFVHCVKKYEICIFVSISKFWLAQNAAKKWGREKRLN